ncbi:penicillin-binding transpeptidase domain-containing protein, partial [Moorena bouillonii]|uniref:penicillin-binding transpeptidase domain-containing protein n=1 Tax=Moorena bouillonii TaxID=207920 RepID=UPI001BE0B2FD
GEGAAAATVVLDVDTGEVLARAQAPDVDLSNDDWYRPVIDGDPQYTGIYGPWADKTGTLGFKQAGSIAKLFTTLAAARDGLPTVAVEGCNIRSIRTFECTKRDHIGSVFDRPGWVRPIHDHPKDRSHGVIDVSEALARSCNVAFSELTLDTGPGPLRRLADQVDIGWERGFEPGAPGTRRLASTGIGQGAAVFNVSQAARMVAAIGGGGVYRRCPPGLRLGDACEETLLVDDPSRLGILLAGMRRAMQTGTGSLLPKVPGVRMYGKTGTADSEATRDEKPYGIGEEDGPLAPHSWFVALAEPESNSPCGTGNTGRLAVATLIARGGGGTRAGAATVEIIAAARNLGYLGDGP